MHTKKEDVRDGQKESLNMEDSSSTKTSHSSGTGTHCETILDGGKGHKTLLVAAEVPVRATPWRPPRKRARKAGTTKKPDNGYTIFFKEEHQRLIEKDEALEVTYEREVASKPGNQQPFRNRNKALVKVISNRWNALDVVERLKYDAMAKVQKVERESRKEEESRFDFEQDTPEEQSTSSITPGTCFGLSTVAESMEQGHFCTSQSSISTQQHGPTKLHAEPAAVNNFGHCMDLLLAGKTNKHLGRTIQLSEPLSGLNDQMQASATSVKGDQGKAVATIEPRIVQEIFSILAEAPGSLSALKIVVDVLCILQRHLLEDGHSVSTQLMGPAAQCRPEEVNHPPERNEQRSNSSVAARKMISSPPQPTDRSLNFASIHELLSDLLKLFVQNPPQQGHTTDMHPPGSQEEQRLNYKKDELSVDALFGRSQSIKSLPVGERCVQVPQEYISEANVCPPLHSVQHYDSEAPLMSLGSDPCNPLELVLKEVLDHLLKHCNHPST